jgi:hypothetical protein
MAIDTIKVFPPIGIARLGNSPDEFFIGPELPGDRTPPANGYKDSRCRVKRQAARFRLFGYENGVLQQEITLADADIKWTVELANTKGSWHKFGGVENPNLPRRNNTDNVPRAPFDVTPGPRTLNGPNQKAGFNTGTFMGSAVSLGEMQMDGEGHLLVLGGFGTSASPTNAPIVHWANNDGWHDDASDGPVMASVLLNNTNNWIQAWSAWVICAPPKFAPPIDNIVTLYDTLYQVAVDKLGVVPPIPPSFSKDIYPLLARAMNMKWVSALAAGAHATFQAVIPPPGPNQARLTIFNRLRNPSLAPHQTSLGSDMPMIWSDVYDTSQGINEALTKTQYQNLKQWKDANFVNDWVGPPPPDNEISPDGMTRAALENCVGGAFYPGIETSFMIRDTYAYLEPFRLDAAQLSAGDLTKQMAVPWQTDFSDCRFDTGLLWWPAQRPDDVFPSGGGGQVPWGRDLISNLEIPGGEDMLKNWYRLGFVVQQGNQYVETERHVVCKDCFVVTDRSTFSADQIHGALTAGPTADFDDSFYVVVEGLAPVDIGVTSSNMTSGQLVGVAPTVSFTRPDASPTPDLSASAQKIMLEDPNLNHIQRLTFSYRVTFTSTAAFISETEVESLTGSIQGMACTGNVLLTKQPNPYMLDGPVSWLSVDVRVFQLTEGDTRFGLPIDNDAAGAVSFIGTLLTNFNAAPASNHPFNTISTDQQTSRLELSRSVNGKGVFNFAVAQVRYTGKILSASDVRVFFRLFTTAATGLDYNFFSTYRRFDDGTKAVPLLGFEGGQVVTIPCFASARVDSTTVSMTTQPEDQPNKHTLNPAGGSEVHGYFGCWLDFNQTEVRVPTRDFAGDGGYGGNAKSIQDAIRGLHQCLVAEVYFSGQPIAAGATPASSDKLSQRNLAILESDNPGGPDAHTIVHTFELKPTLLGVDNFEPFTASTVSTRKAPPDELMIHWLNLPRDTEVTIFMPSIDANELLKFAAQRYEAKRLERVDDHTIRCRFGDVTFIPLPAQPGPQIAGLITLVLPDHVMYRQFFRVVVHQISGVSRRIIGSFQLSIPVKERELLLEPETRNLSVLHFAFDTGRGSVAPRVRPLSHSSGGTGSRLRRQPGCRATVTGWLADLSLQTGTVRDRDACNGRSLLLEDSVERLLRRGRTPA